MLSEREKRQLDEVGLLVLKDFMSAERCEALHRRLSAIFAVLGEKAGAEFKQEPQTDRLANLVEHGELFERAITEPKVLAAVAHVLGPEFKLSSLNARSARPHSDWVQPLHCDTGALPDVLENGEYSNKVCNVIWLLDDFTPENGATRFVPGSHRAGRLPQDVLADASAPHPDEMLVLGRAGTIAVMNAHVWHGGTANRTNKSRLAMHSFYCRRDQPQQQYQKQLLSVEAQQRLTPALRSLLAIDDPLNDKLSLQGSGRSGFLR